MTSFQGGTDDVRGLDLCGSCLIRTWLGVEWIGAAGWDTALAGVVTVAKVLC